MSLVPTTTDIENIDVTKWIQNIPYKLSTVEIYKKFGIDLENDVRNRIFWNITMEKKVLIDEKMYDYLGYSGEMYSTKKNALYKLLNKPYNQHIQYTEVADEHDVRKKYYVLSGNDFDEIIIQMRTPKVRELRKLFSILKTIAIKQHEYEKLYERFQAQMLVSQNNILLHSVHELKSMVTIVQTSADEERQKAAAERQRAEYERQSAEIREQLADEERQKAEMRERRAEEERQRAEQRSRLLTEQMKRNVTILTNVIAPNMAPEPIGKHKIRQLGLYKTAVDNEWYLMRRQQEGWRDAERKLFKRNMTFVKKWDNVPHAIDIGNSVKKHYRQFNWYACGNYLRTNHFIGENANQCVAQIISEIINGTNEAHNLAYENSIFK